MTIQNAMQKAIEGGWNKESFVCPMDTPSANFARAMLDPFFWQSLGKAMGWPTRGHTPEEIKRGNEALGQGTTKDWLYHWHRFIDYLAEGKSVEDFFENI